MYCDHTWTLWRSDKVWLIMPGGTQKENLSQSYSANSGSASLRWEHAVVHSVALRHLQFLLPFTQLLCKWSLAKKGFFFFLAWLVIFSHRGEEGGKKRHFHTDNSVQTSLGYTLQTNSPKSGAQTSLGANTRYKPWLHTAKSQCEGVENVNTAAGV